MAAKPGGASKAAAAAQTRVRISLIASVSCLALAGRIRDSPRTCSLEGLESMYQN
jgi:hypothetical protein